MAAKEEDYSVTSVPDSYTYWWISHCSIHSNSTQSHHLYTLIIKYSNILNNKKQDVIGKKMLR